MAYAADTKVSIGRSFAEINDMLRKAGANQLAQAEMPDKLAIQCYLSDRLLRFAVTIPPLSAMPTRNGRNSVLDDGQRKAILDQKCRQRARALLLVIKAKLESVESGVETFEEAFLANVVMPGGKTVAERVLPQIQAAYDADDGNMPLMIGFGG